MCNEKRLDVKFLTCGKVKIAVLVSGGGTNLQALIDAQASGIIKDGEISLVISNSRSAFAIERAKNAGIAYEIITKKDCGGLREAFEEKIIEKLNEHKIDLIVLAGFMSVLSGMFTAAFPRRIINVHPSLIPSFCGDGFYGLKVHQAALDYGVKITGATVHFVNEITDGGEIIMQKAVDVMPDDTPEILQQRVMREAEHIILPLSVQKICFEILNSK